MIFEYYNIPQQSEKKAKKKIKSPRGMFIDNYSGFDYKKEILRFCFFYMVSVRIWIYNHFVMTQFFEIAKFGDSPEIIDLVLLPFKDIDTFLISDITQFNGRLKDNKTYEEIQKKGKLTNKELMSIPINEFHNDNIYFLLFEELKNKIQPQLSFIKLLH